MNVFKTVGRLVVPKKYKYDTIGKVEKLLASEDNIDVDDLLEINPKILVHLKKTLEKKGTIKKNMTPKEKHDLGEGLSLIKQIEADRRFRKTLKTPAGITTLQKTMSKRDSINKKAAILMAMAEDESELENPLSLKYAKSAPRSKRGGKTKRRRRKSKHSK